MSSYAPLDFWGESPEKQRFQKWPPPVPDEQKFFICGAILTNKSAILTNSAMGISFLTLLLTLNIFLSMNSRWRPQTTRSFVLAFVLGGGSRVVVSTAAFHASVWGSVPGLGGLKETNMFLPHPLVKVSIVGSLRDREVACSASDRQGSNFESCVWRTVSSHHPQEVLLAQFSLYVHKGRLKPDSFHFH